MNKRLNLKQMMLGDHSATGYNQILGGDSGFDRIHETLGACRGAVGLVKSRKKVVANDETYAIAA